MTELVEQSAPSVPAALWTKEEFTRLMRELAVAEAPRLFALVEEYGEAEDARIAGYGLAYADRTDINSAEGDFQLHSQSPERARTLFKIPSRPARRGRRRRSSTGYKDATTTPRACGVSSMSWTRRETPPSTAERVQVVGWRSDPLRRKASRRSATAVGISVSPMLP